MLQNFLTIALFMILMGCNKKNANLHGHYYTSTPRLTNYLDSDLENEKFNSHFNQESYIDFFDNDTYSMYINNYENGTYSVSADTITLLRSDGHQWSILHKEENGFNHFIFPTNKTLITLSKIENEYAPDYPFTPENNNWRIKPQNSLSTNELIDKFQAYNTFMIHNMRWSKNNDQSLSFKNISGPLQFANNGLMMRKLKDTGQWCSYFQEDDCVQMDKILRHYFEGLIIDWKYTNNRIAMLIDALEQVNKGIENHKVYFTE